jgi:hypothetical protein
LLELGSWDRRLLHRADSTEGRLLLRLGSWDRRLFHREDSTESRLSYSDWALGI